MHKVTIKNEDAYDLALVIGSIVNEHSEVLNFKEIVKLQMLVTKIRSVSDEFLSEYNKINLEREELLKSAQKKIASFKKSKIGDGKDIDIDSDFESIVNNYVTAITEDLNSQIKDEIAPKFDELYKSIGKKDIHFELEDDVKEMLVDNFEKFAKTKYTNKSKMLDVYQAIGGTI